MKAQESIISLISALVASMTPVVNITANVADGDNWKLSMCNTFWINTGTTLTIDGNSYEVVSFLRNDHIIVSGSPQPAVTWFQLDAPAFWYGSRRKVDGERTALADMSVPMVYLPPLETTHPSGDNTSDIAYTAPIRPIFLNQYDVPKDEIGLQQTELIDPLNAMADFFIGLINADWDTFDETEEFIKKDWPNFGDPNVWGNDELIFNQPLSGVEVRATLNVFPSYECNC